MITERSLEGKATMENMKINYQTEEDNKVMKYLWTKVVTHSESLDFDEYITYKKIGLLPLLYFKERLKDIFKNTIAKYAGNRKLLEEPI